MDAFAELMRHRKRASVKERSRDESHTKRTRKSDGAPSGGEVTAERCPICWRIFPVNILEAHASVCEGLPSDIRTAPPKREQQASEDDTEARQWKCMSQAEAESSQSAVAKMNAFDTKIMICCW